MQRLFKLPRKAYLIGLVFVGIFLFTRLYRLTIIPIFFDEANYIYWAKIIASSNRQWFISLSAGKPVPLIWMMAILLKLFPASEYLLASRLPSVFFGTVSLFTVFKLGELLFNKRVGVISAFIYLFIPFALFHERMALYESMLTATTVLAVYFAVRSAKSFKLVDLGFWGISLGLALMSKASAMFFVVATPIVFVLMNKINGKNLRKSVKPILVAVFIGIAFSNLIIFSSGYQDYLHKSVDYTPGAKSLTLSLTTLFLPNLVKSISWLNSYLTWPILFLCSICLVFLLVQNLKKGIMFGILIFGPVLLFSYLGRIFFPRYLIVVTPYVAILAGLSLYSIFNRGKLLFLLFAICVLYLPLKFDYFLLTAPRRANFPQPDNWQYVSGYPSGFGLQTIYDQLRSESKDKKINVLIQGSYSQYPNAFYLEFWGNKNIHFEERWPLLTSDLMDSPEKENLYAVVHDDFVSGYFNQDKKYPLKIIAVGKKPEGKDSIYLGKFIIPGEN